MLILKKNFSWVKVNKAAANPDWFESDTHISRISVAMHVSDQFVDGQPQLTE